MGGGLVSSSGVRGGTSQGLVPSPDVVGEGLVPSSGTDRTILSCAEAPLGYQ